MVTIPLADCKYESLVEPRVPDPNYLLKGAIPYRESEPTFEEFHLKLFGTAFKLRHSSFHN